MCAIFNNLFIMRLKKFLMSISCSQSMPTAAAAVAAMAAAAQVWLIWWLGKCHAHINLIANRLYACICVCVCASQQTISNNFFEHKLNLLIEKFLPREFHCNTPPLPTTFPRIPSHKC